MEPFLKPLSAQEEKSCLDAYQRGDTKARDILVERNLRLVAHVVKKYQGLPDDLDDLISIGTIGLIKAVMTYDSKKGNRLAAYAARCIDNELLMYLRSKKKTAREISLYECLCKWTVFMHMLFYVWVCLCSESSGAESVIHKCIWI